LRTAWPEHRRIKRQLEQAANANQKSLSAEIVARLAQSFDVAAPEIDPGEVAGSHEARLKVIEDALRVLGSNDCYLDILNGPAQKLLAGILDKLPPKGS
jgi:hypothetical protein